MTWITSSASVATVDQSGLVTAVGNGTAVISARVNEGSGATGTVIMTVMQVVDLVEVSPATAELTVLGATVQLTAEAFDANGHAVAEAEFSWESSNVAVATVDASGLVTGVAEGVATITVDAASASGSTRVTVMQSVPVAQVPVVIDIDAVYQSISAGSLYDCNDLLCRHTGRTSGPRSYDVVPIGDTLRVERTLSVGATLYDDNGQRIVQRDLDVVWHVSDTLRYETTTGHPTEIRPSNSNGRWSRSFVPDDCQCNSIRLGPIGVAGSGTLPIEPFRTDLIATVEVSDSVILSDTVAILVPARMSFNDRLRDMPFPVHIDVGGSADIDLNGLYRSPRGLPVTYELTGGADRRGAPPMADSVIRVENRGDNRFTIHGLGNGHAVFSVKVRTALEYFQFNNSRGVYVGELPCPAFGHEPVATAGFRIEYRGYAGFSPCVESVLAGAAGWWQRVLSETELPASTKCGTAASVLEIEIDIRWQGLGGPVAGALPGCSDGLPRTGLLVLSEQMFVGWGKDNRFHSPAINLLYQSVRSEIGHVLGLAGLFNHDELVKGDIFIGQLATAAYGASEDGVPLEPGDRSHWSSDALGSELMTAGIRFDEVPPASAVTLGALADFGWTVDMTMAEDWRR